MKIANIGGAKAAMYELKNETYYLLFNGIALFALQDKFGTIDAIMDFLNSELNEEYINNLIDVAIILSEQGELARREIHLEPKEILSKDNFGNMTFIMPIDIMMLRNRCADAIVIGYSREVRDDDEEIDLGLLELQKKRN